MQRLLILLALLSLVYLIWRFVVRGDALVLVRPGQPAAVTAWLNRFVPGEALAIAFRIHSGRHRITEISLARSLAQSLGLQAPSGFSVEDLPLSRKEQNDAAMRAFVADYNRDNLRWVGSFELTADSESELVFPMTVTEATAGILRFTCETRLGTGFSMSFLQVAVGAAENIPVAVAKTLG